MLVTIYTDAGIRFQKACYAYAITWHLGRIYDSGEYTDEPCNSTNFLEFYAINRACAAAIKEWPNVKVLFINCDNGAVCKTFWDAAGIATKRHYGNSRSLIPHVEAQLAAMKVLGIEMRVKYVKGHQAGNNIRAWMNNKVDSMVRQQYKKQ